ncbi:MAG: SUMF1/EgtB/PvdO family nonheme iron enzyme [Candidatus Competibacterales bacterium]
MGCALVVGVAHGQDRDDDGIPDELEIVKGTDPDVKDNSIFSDIELFVEQLYRDFLEREADPEGLNFWVNAIANGELDEADMVVAYLFAPEFLAQVEQRFPGIDDPNELDTVALYVGMLKRNPDSEGLAFWKARFEAGEPRQSLAWSFLTSEEYRLRFLLPQGLGLTLTAESDYLELSEESLPVTTLFVESDAVLGSSRPVRVDLSSSFPPPGAQGRQFSCVAWGATYAIKTYYEKIERGWDLLDEQGQLIEDRVFSPAFNFNLHKSQTGGRCGEGVLAREILDLLKNVGAVTLSQMPYDPTDPEGCTMEPSPEVASVAAQEKILGWGRVPVAENRRLQLSDIKGLLARGDPVLIGMQLYQSFEDFFGFEGLLGATYAPDTQRESYLGDHAAVVVGYDDERGAFRVMNSWGQDWGEDGFFWFPYQAFEALVGEAYVIHNDSDDAIEFTQRFGQGPLPNLVVNLEQVSLRGGGAFVTPGQTIEVRFAVANEGLSASSPTRMNVTLTALDNPDQLPQVVVSQAITGLEANAVFNRQAIPLQFSLPNTLATGDYTLKLRVDPQDEIRELDEGDNVSQVQEFIPFVNDTFIPPSQVDDPSLPADNRRPTASLLPVAPLETPGGSALEIVVAYRDNRAIEPQSLDDGDVIVSGLNVTLADVTAVAGGVDATYRVAAPNGAWSAADNGSYTVLLLGGGVIDTSGNGVFGATLGFFEVAIDDSAAPVPTNTFRDALQGGGQGPIMVALPGGSVVIGSPPGEADREDDEHQRSVTLSPFAMSRHEVTFAEYDRFALATGRGLPDDATWGREDRPVIYVSWADAKAYTDWLSAQTGTQYRLPTEAEWEYAARAGTLSSRHWGDNPHLACRYGNVADLDIGSVNGHNCRDGVGIGTAPVGTYQANGFELYDTLGNVVEWTCSAYTPRYDGTEEVCLTTAAGDTAIAIRGGGWSAEPRQSRVANRGSGRAGGRSNLLGFRVVKVL